MRLDALAPAPFATVLAAAGVADTAMPFAEALDLARRSRSDEDSIAGLIETAGIPVLRSAPDACLAAVVVRARTPMAIIHVAAAAHALGRPPAEIARAAEAFLASAERHGHLH